KDRPGLRMLSARRHRTAFAHPACEVANLAYFAAPPFSQKIGMRPHSGCVCASLCGTSDYFICRMKLGFIGCGKMATALIKGVLKSGLGSPKDITASDVHTAAAEKLARETGVATVASNLDVVNASDTIVLAVKPGDAVAAIQNLAS